MKLRTSFFNTTVLRKDITRFAPVWGLYTIFSLMVLFLSWASSTGSSAQFAGEAGYMMQSMGVLNFIYATICALTLFGDLFSTRMCNALHAFPMRREGWFFTHCVAGFLFCLIPNGLTALLAGVLLQKYFYFSALWLAVTLLQFLFFFGVGIFSVMCAGTRLGAAAVCGIINFFAALFSWLFQAFYEPLLYGIDLDPEIYTDLSPVVGFADSDYITTSYDKMTDLTRITEVSWVQWYYLFAAAGVGILLLGLALLIYRKRHLENAGNLISLKGVSPVILIIYTLCAGALTYYAAGILTGTMQYIFLLIGLAIGFFTGRMLLEKKVNVFRGKTFLAFGVLLAVFGITVGLTWLDPASVTRYVPETESIAQVQISPKSSAYYYERYQCILTEQEDIQTITQLHQEIVDNRRTGYGSDLRIIYTLKNGRTIERHYTLDSQDPAIQAVKPYYSSPAYVLGTEDIDSLLNNAIELEAYGGAEITNCIYITSRPLDSQEYMDKSQEYMDKYDGNTTVYLTEELVPEGTTPTGLNVELARGLMEAVIADCETGNMVQLWDYHDEDDESYGWITIQTLSEPTDDLFTYTGIYVESQPGQYMPITYLEIRIYESCTNTISYLENLFQK